MWHLTIKSLQNKYLCDYLILHNKKVKFFKQHNIWKYKKALTKLFDFPETIHNITVFEFNLYVLENFAKENR